MVGCLRFATPALRQVGFDNVQCHIQVHGKYLRIVQQQDHGWGMYLVPLAMLQQKHHGARWPLEKMVSPYLWGYLAWPECLRIGNNVHPTKRAGHLASHAWTEAVGQAVCRAQREGNCGDVLLFGSSYQQACVEYEKGECFLWLPLLHAQELGWTLV